MVMPGDNAEVTCELIFPMPIHAGMKFAFREGGRTVGRGVVGKVIECAYAIGPATFPSPGCLFAVRIPQRHPSDSTRLTPPAPHFVQVKLGLGEAGGGSEF